MAVFFWQSSVTVSLLKTELLKDERVEIYEALFTDIEQLQAQTVTLDSITRKSFSCLSSQTLIIHIALEVVGNKSVSQISRISEFVPRKTFAQGRKHTVSAIIRVQYV